MRFSHTSVPKILTPKTLLKVQNWARWTHLWLSIVFVIAFSVSFWQLRKNAILNWDEGFYTDGMRQIFITKNLVVPYWNHQPFLDKPPLHIIVGTVGVFIFGQNEFGYRFTSATALTFVLFLSTWWVYKKFGWLPSLITFSSLITNNILIWRGHYANTDAVLTFFVLLTFLVTVSKVRYRYPLLGILLGLTYLTKAGVAFFPAGAVGLYEVFEYFRTEKWEVKKRLVLVLCALVLPGIWLLAGYLQEGWRFIQFYLFQSDYETSSISLTQWSLFYPKVMISSMHVYTLALAVSVLNACIEVKKSLPRTVLLFALPLPFFLSFSSVHYHWYLLPVMPLLSILIGYTFWKVTQYVPWQWVKIMTVIVVIFITIWAFYKRVIPIYAVDVAYPQQQSGLKLKSLTAPNEIIIRLDHLYPTMIHYSERRVLASDKEQQVSKDYFLTRKDLQVAVQQGTYHWVVGKNEDVAKFLQQVPDVPYEIIDVADSEKIIHFL